MENPKSHFPFSILNCLLLLCFRLFRFWLVRLAAIRLYLSSRRHSLRILHLLLLTHLLYLLVGNRRNRKVRGHLNIIACHDLLEQLLFLLCFKLVADIILDRSLACRRIVRIFDAGRDQNVAYVIRIARSRFACRSRLFRFLICRLVWAWTQFTLKLNYVKSEIGFDKVRSNLSGLKCEGRSLKWCDHPSLCHVLVESALRCPIRSLIARIFAKLISKCGKILAGLCPIQDALCLCTFLCRVDLGVVGNIFRNFVVRYLGLVRDLF